MHTNELSSKPHRRFVGTITIDVQTSQFKSKTQLEKFLAEILHSYNGTKFQMKAIPIVHTEEDHV